MTSELTKAITILSSAQYLIALTGAGISKESNIPTFRGKDGLWQKYNVMDLATPSAFERDPKLVWEWYSWRQDLILKCAPNPAHFTLAKWEQKGFLKSLITQNVDGLHRQAESQNVYEVHGNIWTAKCMSCSYQTQLNEPVSGIPLCHNCGARLRPSVIWFGESLDSDLMAKVLLELNRADVVIVIGTSAIVQPSASFPLIVKRNEGQLIEINVEKTPLTQIADIHLKGKAGEILPQLDSLLD